MGKPALANSLQQFWVQQMWTGILTNNERVYKLSPSLRPSPLTILFFFSLKIHLDGTVDEAMALWMATMTTAQTGDLEDEDPPEMIEVGAVPTVVTGVEARLINQCKMQVGTFRMMLF